ncbi:low molecular weight protein arginine phosphatase [Paenibacillus antibioticophila]|uniref:low molecular weight protein arginine phosphatase n=1 Tax=Paenibacillus antibioticophila TaxID=1274374 RepID=UPI0008FED959|nr:low molecular weight protein arginine phosphatase [Paenibacillus antibioticophila]
MRILFVCTGNTCRSPMAEGIMRKLVADRGLRIEVRSAGVAASTGASMSRHAEAVLRDKGIVDKFASTQLHSEQVEWADLILTLTESHKQHIRFAFPTSLDKVYTLKEYVSDGSGMAESYDISDPYGGSRDDYDRTAEEIAAALDKLADKLGGQA